MTPQQRAWPWYPFRNGNWLSESPVQDPPCAECHEFLLAGSTRDLLKTAPVAMSAAPSADIAQSPPTAAAPAAVGAQPAKHVGDPVPSSAGPASQARTKGCPAHVLAAIYGKKPANKAEAYDHSLKRCAARPVPQSCGCCCRHTVRWSYSIVTMS